MKNKQSLHDLELNRENIESLIQSYSNRTIKALPHELEIEFLALNLKRARKSIAQLFWPGVITYLLFICIILLGDLWIIQKEVFWSDFLKTVFSLVIGAVGFFALYAFSSIDRYEAYYERGVLIIFFAVVISMIALNLFTFTPDLRFQSISLIFIIYILGYILTGIKPEKVLYIGMLAAAIIMFVNSHYHIDFNSVVLLRVLFGSCILGFVISKMLLVRERIIFLYLKRAKLNVQIQTIYNRNLLNLSQQDELTKIPNRRMFDERFEILFDEAKQTKTPLALIFIDIDAFKNYNDYYGHPKGDDVIVEIAATIQNSIRHIDFVARYGGEEFIVLLPRTDEQGAYAVASNILKAVEELNIEHVASQVCKRITLSLGFSVLHSGSFMSKEELLNTADQALYRAKKLGRNQIYYLINP